MEVYDEDKVIAEGILSLDDWDDEELIRGYRRSRNGRWGPAPKYIPREVQLEVFRRLVQRGDRKMREAYLKSISNLVDLSEDASSEKVRLDAIKELMNRVVGKVPDRVHIGVEQPYESILADALVPLSESAVLDLDTDDDGVAFLAPYAGDESAGEVETDTARDAASRGPATVNGTPSPARTSKSKKKPNK
jgi:hypothetical protein